MRKSRPDLAQVIDGVSVLGDPELKAWLRSVDESRYGLEDWLTALSAFYTWLPSLSEISVPDALEYLSCCAEGAQIGGSAGSLVDAALEYYQLYGVEGLRPL
ncbi:MAG: hypothetical protein H7222_14320 [Methylotenera sp.]|nr:hypothetical protein [Oligoflexia bacterium]